jgi:hypothetical protein
MGDCISPSSPGRDDVGAIRPRPVFLLLRAEGPGVMRRFYCLLLRLLDLLQGLDLGDNATIALTSFVGVIAGNWLRLTVTD